jgi:S1-C subfamily serine protease
VGTAVLVVAAALAALSAARPGPARGPLTGEELERVVAAAREATALVSSEWCGQRVRGSAFAVDGHLVTNSHVVGGAPLVHVAASGSVWRVPVLAVHDRLDLSVLAGVGTRDLELAPARPEPGDPVVLAGRPGGGAVTVATSEVHLYAEGRPWGVAGDVLLLDHPTGPGWSGGPVLDRHGRVVAVLAARDEVTGLAVAIPLGDLAAWLDDPPPEHRPAATCGRPRP